MSSKYTYSITNDFPNNKVNPTLLTNEINDSSITPSLEYVNTDDSTCDIWFASTLSASDTTSLTTVVSVHSGDSIPSIYNVIAGEDLDARKPLYYSGDNEVKLSRADMESMLPCVGFTATAATQGNLVEMYTNDILDGFSGLTPGQEYYLDSTAGEMITIKPTSGTIVRLGVAKTPTEFDIHILELASSSVYGSEYQYIESDGESSTTSSEWQQKVNLITETIPLGTYRVEWFAELKAFPGGKLVTLKVDVDGTTICESLHPGAYSTISGFKEGELSNASHNVEISYRKVDAIATCYIRRARLNIWRIL